MISKRSMRQSREIAHIYRRDKTNVGDIWSPPKKYFNIAGREFDIKHIRALPTSIRLSIIGGGGLGREGAFKYSLDQLSGKTKSLTLIAWGVGGDTVTDKTRPLESAVDMQALLKYWENFDLIGTRIFTEKNYPDKRYKWVPCASCMSNYFDELRESTPRAEIGVYSHKRMDLKRYLGENGFQIKNTFLNSPFQNNAGANILKKLRFLAQHETIITNSYHGVYWATLLNRKVVCLPFKNGLFSFKHSPSFVEKNQFRLAIKNAQRYPLALEECRNSNKLFFNEVCSQYLQ